METFPTGLQRPLSRRLMPLAYALVVMIGLILTFTWVSLQVQVTLAGFLNGESLWSKAQKQEIIDLDAYASTGNPEQLEAFRRNAKVLAADRWIRDTIDAGHYKNADLTAAFREGGVIPSAVPGIIFMFRHFAWAPHMKQALAAWRASDDAIAELDVIANELQTAYATGAVPLSYSLRVRERILALNDHVEPLAKVFSVEVAEGAVWVGSILYGGVVTIALIAMLLWFTMAKRILTSVRGTEERYRLLFDSAADAIAMVDESTGYIVDANQTMLDWTGRQRTDLLGDRFVHLFQYPLRNDPGHAAINVLLTENDSSRPVETQSNLVTWADRSIRQTIIRDISERVKMEQERLVAAEALASIAEAVIISDAQYRVTSVNAAHELLTGYSRDAMLGRSWAAMRTMPDGSPIPSSVWERVAKGDYWRGEVETVRADGTCYPEQLSISAIRDEHGDVLHYVAVFTDVSSTKANERRLEYLARHDPLTGLVNRGEFERLCAEAIVGAERDGTAVAVLFIDLDAFKNVNDSYSHAVGDRLLVAVAERISGELDEDVVSGRIGGDEFTVLIRGLVTREQVRVIADRLLAALAKSLTVEGKEIVLTASIGAAAYPLDGADPPSLIANADAAMYAAKTEERNAVRLYTPVMHADSRRRMQVATELRQGLERDELRVVYQPSVDMKHGRIVACEALVRWQHPDRGLLMPVEFIAVAEELGLIRLVDEWVLAAACAQIKAWDSSGMPPIRVAVNVSARWFGHPGFVRSVTRTLQESGIPPDRIVLEITESAMLRLGDGIERTMETLQKNGVAVAIDDFGTGYSSMAYLKLPAVAYLKIDRSFVIGLPQDSNDAAIVKAILAMAQSLALATVAEGIETEEQDKFLRLAGCNEGQGFLYSFPLEPHMVEELLRPKDLGLPRGLSVVPPKRSR